MLYFTRISKNVSKKVSIVNYYNIWKRQSNAQIFIYPTSKQIARKYKKTRDKFKNLILKVNCKRVKMTNMVF